MRSLAMIDVISLDARGYGLIAGIAACQPLTRGPQEPYSSIATAAP